MEKKQIIARVIPSEIIIYDILTRVPTKSLLRLRCVCKKWYNLFFRDRLFVNLHVQRLNKSTSSGLIDKNHDNGLVFIDPNDKNKNRIIPITVGYSSEVVDIQDSLNGLLILARYNNLEDFHPTYYVYNPITNCSIIIPKPIKDADYYYYFRLCYDVITEQYKVVEVSESYPTILEIKILTLKHGLEEKSHEDDYSWRDIVVPTPGGTCLNLSFQPFYLNGFLYWIIETWEVSIDTHTNSLVTAPGLVNPYILGLDTSREMSCKIKLPKEVLTSVGDFKNLNEMEGLLCLSQYLLETHELKIWILKKKNHDEDEWTEMFKIDMNTGNAYTKLSNGIGVLAILTVPKLKFIITDSIGSSYFSYDMESEQMEIIHGQTNSKLHWHVNSIANW